MDWSTRPPESAPGGAFHGRPRTERRLRSTLWRWVVALRYGPVSFMAGADTKRFEGPAIAAFSALRAGPAASRRLMHEHDRQHGCGLGDLHGSPPFVVIGKDL